MAISLIQRLQRMLDFSLDTRFQIVWTTLSMALVGLFFHEGLKQFTTSDPHPGIQYLLPQKIGHSLATTTVNMGFTITNFSQFDTARGEFTIDAIIWFSFNPSEYSLETVSDISFENGIIQNKSSPITQMVGDTLFAQYTMRVQFQSKLDYRFFPINDHRIFIIITNKNVWPNELTYSLSTTNFNVAEQSKIPGWKIYSKFAEYGYLEYMLDQTDRGTSTRDPRVLLSMDFRKEGNSRLSLIILPLLVLFYIALFTLSLPLSMDHGPLLGTSVACVSGLLAYRFVIQTLSPVVSYFTLGDYLFIFILICSFIVLILNFMGVWLEKTFPQFQFFRSTGIIIFHTLLPVLIAYLLFFWQR